MLSLRQTLALAGKEPPIGVRKVLPSACNSLLDSLVALNHVPCALLILAPKAFESVMIEFANYKVSIGIATIVRTLDHVYQAHVGVDEAEKVKRCIALFQPNNGVKYVILAGDQDVFPVRYTKWTNIGNPQDFDTLYVPTDLYYSCLFRQNGEFDDWDFNKNRCFGEAPYANSDDPVNPDHVSVIPSVAVGRIPASDTDEIGRYVRKVQYYERNMSAADWAKSALLLASRAWPEDGSACGYQEDIATKYLVPAGYSVYRLYEPGGVCLDGSSCPVTAAPTRIEINNQLKKGRGFVAYIGHGEFDRWFIGDTPYTVDNVDKLEHFDELDNSVHLPIVFAAACNTGAFAPLPPKHSYRDAIGNDHLGTDNGEVFRAIPPRPACIQTKKYEEIKRYESMAEQMTVKSRNGSIAYVGATLTSGGPQLDLHRFFFAAIHSNCLTLGDMYLYMLRRYYELHVPPNNPDRPGNSLIGIDWENFHHPWRFCLFGDPSLRVGYTPQ